MRIIVIRSSRSRTVSRSGLPSGSRCKPSTLRMRWPRAETISTSASSATSATAKSPGYDAMHLSLVPSTACIRLQPSSAPQPVPGSRPGRLGERQVSLRSGAVLVVGRSVAWRTPVAQADRPFLLDHFAALEDPRQRAKVLYPLPEILLLLLCATLAGADDV